jgi:hypothetical protein
VDRPPSCCNFCGDSRTFQEYPTDNDAVNWHACANCARLIDAEQWEQLIERSLAVPDSVMLVTAARAKG